MDSPRIQVLVVVGLLFCALVAYLPAIGYTFVADDTSQILANNRIHSWQYAPSFFTAHVWAHIKLAPGEHAAPYFRPVFLLWLLANYSLFGYTVPAWHASAILLHLVVTLLVYFVTKRLMGDWRLAATATLFFALHPTHIEAVAWVSGATESIMAIPFLGSVLCYLEAVNGRRKAVWMTGSLFLYAAAIFAKETAIMLPAVLIAYELLLRPWPEGERKLPAILKRISGFVLVTAGYWVCRSLALRDVQLLDFPLTTMFYTWPSTFWFYLKHLLWPTNLSFFYNVAPVSEFEAGPVLLPLALVVIPLGALAVWARKNRRVAFAAAWAVLLILPPLYLRVFVPVELVHDRYLYLPSIGFCMILALAIWSLAGLFRNARQAALWPTAFLALAYLGVTFDQSRYWSDEAALFTHSFRIGNQNWSAERNFAFMLGRTGHCDVALPVLARVAERDAIDPKATFALGACYFHKGYWDDAERIIRRTIALSPDYQQPHLMLASIRLMQGRIDDADQAWNAASKVQDSRGEEELSLHYVHGEILKAKGDFRGAAEEFRKELLVQPGNAEILSELDAVSASLPASEKQP